MVLQKEVTMGRFFLDMEFTNGHTGGYTGSRSVGGREWKRISQLSKDKLFGTKTVADGDYKYNY